MKKSTKKTIIVIAVAVIFLLFCTGKTYLNYVKGLNKVSTVNSASGIITANTKVDGYLKFVSECTLTLPVGASIMSIPIGLGENFKEGDILVMLDDYTGIKAPCAGQMISMGVTLGELITEENNWLLYGDLEAGLLLKWELTPEQYIEYTNISVETPTFGVNAECDGVRGIYDPTQKCYLFEMVITEVRNCIGVCEGQPAEVTMHYQSELYEHILPKSCIYYSSSGECVYVVKERNTMWGREQYLERKNVQITNSGDEFVAVTMSVGNVVSGALRTPTNYEAVLVME